MTYLPLTVSSSVTMPDNNEPSSTPLILALLFFWIILVLVLIYLYKRLNRDTNGQYTVQRFVYKEGGLRDRVIQGIEAVNGFVERIRPQNRDEEALGGDEEMNRGEDEEEEGEEEGDSEGQNETNADRDEDEAKDDSSDDYSSVDLRERVKQNNSTEEQKIKEEQKEETKDENEEKENEHKEEEGEKDEERVGLLVNIKPFSGSAIWSEEKTDESSVTAL